MSGIYLIAALALAFVLPAQAQTPWPKTMKVYNKDQVVGTATVHRNVIYMRDLKGELIGTATVEKDGKQTFRDPNGKQVEGLQIAPPSE